MSGSLPATRLVILGAEHSAQLVAKSYQPAVFRAYLRRVNPDIICLEHPVEDYARNDFRYGQYAYEKHFIALPWAQERGIPLYPIDWVPPADDQMLVWGLKDLESPPFFRHDYSRFLRFDADKLALDLFVAESAETRQAVAAWYDQPRQEGERDFPRRLGLYRTYLQAMRIKAVINRHPGATILVLIGYFHKGDIERVLGQAPGLRITQPSAFGSPSATEIEAEVTRHDLLAILSFNLLGVQSQGPVNWDWLARCLDRVEEGGATAETALLRTRRDVLHHHLPGEHAVARYRALQPGTARFTFDGVQDRSRLDSYYDPFGNLTVAQRALLEIAREYYQLGRAADAERVKYHLVDVSDLSVLQSHQLLAYWDAYLQGMR